VLAQKLKSNNARSPSPQGEGSRVRSIMNEEIKIVNFDQSLASHFTALNLAWIRKYFEVEAKDEEVLGDPQRHIIDKGGQVFFAKLNEEIVGTFALMKMSGGVFELGKMAVSEQHQGKKIGNMMLEFCLQAAKELKVQKVVLYSNTILQPAIHLYKKFGFKEVPLENSEYKRSNIKMQIDITN
jgi:ribosomal protein S18 acetylase RimI-like enzyme